MLADAPQVYFVRTCLYALLARRVACAFSDLLRPVDSSAACSRLHCGFKVCELLYFVAHPALQTWKGTTCRTPVIQDQVGLVPTAR